MKRLLTLPVVANPSWSAKELQDELDNNVQVPMSARTE